MDQKFLKSEGFFQNLKKMMFYFGLPHAIISKRSGAALLSARLGANG